MEKQKELLLLADTGQRDLVPLSGYPLKIESDFTTVDFAAQSVVQQYNPLHNRSVALASHVVHIWGVKTTRHDGEEAIQPDPLDTIFPTGWLTRLSAMIWNNQPAYAGFTVLQVANVSWAYI